MKKNSKLLSLLLIALLIAPLLVPLTADAAVKISLKSKTMYVGDSYTLKVSGTKNPIKWSSSKKTVATITSKGKVTAKAEGTATISAKVSNKTYKCTITVKSRFNPLDAAKKVTYEFQDTGSGVVALVTNNNTVAVNISAKLVYYSGSGSMIKAVPGWTHSVEPGAIAAIFFDGPVDSNYNKVVYSDYKLSMLVEKTYATEFGASKIKVTSNMGADNITAEFENVSSIDLDSIEVAIVFYDRNKNAIGYDYGYVGCHAPGSTDFKTFDFPFNDDYDTLYPTSYKIYINSAYGY